MKAGPSPSRGGCSAALGFVAFLLSARLLFAAPPHPYLPGWLGRGSCSKRPCALTLSRTHSFVVPAHPATCKVDALVSVHPPPSLSSTASCTVFLFPEEKKNHNHVCSVQVRKWNDSVNDVLVTTNRLPVELIFSLALTVCVAFEDPRKRNFIASPWLSRAYCQRNASRVGME